MLQGLKRFASNGKLPLDVLLALDKYEIADRGRTVRHCTTFYGDIPPFHQSPGIGHVDRPPLVEAAAEQRQNFICSEAWDVPRPVKEYRHDILYSVDGVAFHKGAVVEMGSVRVVRGTWPYFRYPRKSRVRRFAQGTIIEGEHPNTYGDWVSEQIRSLALAGRDILEPLLLPGFLGNRGYVRRELDRLGIAYVALDAPAFIEKVCVLRKPSPFIYWTAEEARAYRRLFGITLADPAPGSLLYLSRAGVQSEQGRAVREFRSEICAEVVEEMGGRVVQTSDLTFDDFTALGAEAEIVVADHGAAIFNILQWRTRGLIEIVTDNWWDKCFVFLGVACDVERHAVVRSDPKSDDELRASIRGHIEACRSAFRESRGKP